jgi:protein-L-isoaspartate(D-aspartate) O-methyltransferase
MVADLARRGIRDERVLRAFLEVPREAFVPRRLKDFAYADRALPIAAGQSISQPFVVALTLQALQLAGDEYVLDVGTGSGYAAALLSRLARRVASVERLRPLARDAAARLRSLGYRVSVVHGDGTLGWPELAPFDAIAVAASGPQVPSALLAQLRVGGSLVMPLRDDTGERLAHVTADERGLARVTAIENVRFVPLIGSQGYRPEAEAPAEGG